MSYFWVSPCSDSNWRSCGFISLLSYCVLFPGKGSSILALLVMMRSRWASVCLILCLKVSLVLISALACQRDMVRSQCKISKRDWRRSREVGGCTLHLAGWCFNIVPSAKASATYTKPMSQKGMTMLWRICLQAIATEVQTWLRGTISSNCCVKHRFPVLCPCKT